MANHSMPRKPWTWTLSLLAVVLTVCSVTTTANAQPSESQNNGLVSKIFELPVTVARALNRIRESPRDCQLVDDLWFEKLPKNDHDDDDNTALKSPTNNLVDIADAVFDTHRLSLRNAIIPGIVLNVHKGPTQQYEIGITRQNNIVNDDVYDPATRTFGLGIQRRRLQFVMLPVMYKLGVITTLLTGLTVLSLKGVTIGLILLMLAVTSIVAKLSKVHHYSPYSAPPPWSGHDPYDRSSLPLQPHDKNIHVHVHTAPGMVSSPGMALKSSSAYAAAYGGGPTAPDDGNAGPYWNRVNDEYYDVGQYYHDNHRTSDAEHTTVNSVYHRWLG